MRFTVGHLYSGIGGVALGTAAAEARFGDLSATFVTVGGIDVDRQACEDFKRLTGAPALCADMHELQPAALRAAWGPTAPDAVFSSPPCKGLSGLLSKKRAAEEKYVRMNGLLLRGLFLVCSTWEQPPPLIFFENVPRIATRGRAMVEQARQLLEAHGYAVHVGNHDCGELGGLAQHRRRWFMLARHRSRVPQLIYQPPKQRVRACGEVLGPLPMPGDVGAAGAMHSIPRLSWRNWVRLALIPAGGDWRDLPSDAELSESLTRHHNKYTVAAWGEPAGTVIGASRPGSGAPSVADPRFTNIMHVTGWGEPARTVVGASRPGGGAPSVADPRVNIPSAAAAESSGIAGVNGATGTGRPQNIPENIPGRRPTWQHVAGVTHWSEPAPTITGQAKIHTGAFQVADPRPRGWFPNVLGVTDWASPAGTVTGQGRPTNGAFSVADPRMGCAPRAGAYRVLRWDEAAATITGSLRLDNGPAAVADPRIDPDRPPPFTPIIIAADGTWHRPLTTLELAALQGLPVRFGNEPLVLAGRSHTRWREAIGNCVPPPAARAVAEQLLLSLLVSYLGAMALSPHDVWVQPEDAR